MKEALISRIRILKTQTFLSWKKESMKTVLSATVILNIQTFLDSVLLTVNL